MTTCARCNDRGLSGFGVDVLALSIVGLIFCGTTFATPSHPRLATAGAPNWPQPMAGEGPAVRAALARASVELHCPPEAMIAERLFVQPGGYPTFRIDGCARQAQYTCLLYEGSYPATDRPLADQDIEETVCIREPVAGYQ